MKSSEAGIDRMSPAEFRAQGYLAELNRQFLHPLGLALEMIVDDDGSERFGGVWDYRDDPEGMAYHDDDLAAVEKGGRWVREEQRRRRPAREKALGFWIQPPACPAPGAG